MPDNEYTTTERVAIVTHHLTIGKQLSTADVASLTGLSRCGAWQMLNKLSRVLPIAEDRNDKGRLVWHSIE